MPSYHLANYFINTTKKTITAKNKNKNKEMRGATRLAQYCTYHSSWGGFEYVSQIPLKTGFI